MQNNLSQETGVIAWMAKNPVAANLLMLVVMVAGIGSLFTITKEIWPTYESESLTISVPYPGSSPEEVEQGILIKIEESIQDVIGIKDIYSTASEGSGYITVQFEPGTDVADALNKVKARVDGIASFPLDAEPPVIEESILRTRVIFLTLYGELSEKQLTELADDVREELLKLLDITQIDIRGTRDYEIAIEVSNQALRQYGLQFDDVVTAIRNQSRDLPGGNMRTESGVISLRSMGQAYTAAEFSALTLINRSDGTRITVGDVAEVIDGFEDQPMLNRLNGGPGVTLRVMRVGDQNAMTISEQVRAYAQQKQASLPAGVKIAVWADRTEILKSRINLLLTSALQGMLLVMITLALFLQPTLAFWVVAGLPFCFLGTLMVMNLPAVDLSVNVISLFGFILVLGILVDDAIVTGESAYDQLEKDNNGVESIIRGVKRVAVPTVFGVLTTVLAFMPTLFIEEGIGRMFSASAPVVIIALLFSLLETKFILPAHLRHLRINRAAEQRGGLVARWNQVQRRVSDGLIRLANRRYLPLLRRAVKYRYISLAIFIGVFILAIMLVSSGLQRVVFFPTVPSNSIRVDLAMPQGTPYQKTHEYALHIEKAALAVNERYRQQHGEDVIVALEVESTTDNIAEITAELLPSTDRSMTSMELGRWWREEIGQLSGVRSLSLDARVGHGGLPINLELQSDDLQQLRLAAEEVKLTLRDYDGVFDVRDTFDAGGPEVDIRITRQGQALGLGQAELARQVRQAFFGAEVQRLQRQRHEVRVYVRFPAGERDTLETLRSMWVQLPDGSKVPFEVVGEIVESTGINTIQRVNRHRVVNVQADVDKTKTSPAAITAQIEREVLPEILQRYPSVNYRFAGEAEEQAENTNSLLAGTLVVLILLFAALAIPLRSYGKPLIIMSVIPFGIVGAILGHFILGKPLSVFSAIGMLALSGVVVNDSLVLVDYINHRVAEGVAWTEATLEAGVRRFRAVLLTSITTFMGLLPIQMETSIQSEFLKPMAISIAFGVLFATLVTLILVPVLCFIAHDVQRRLQGREQYTEQTQPSNSQ